MLLQIRRQQSELARWRQLEADSPTRIVPPGSALDATRRLQSSPHNRATASANGLTPHTPRREVQELQALVIERRELMARQKQNRSEASARTLKIVRELQPGATRDATARTETPHPPGDAHLHEGPTDYRLSGVSSGEGSPPGMIATGDAVIEAEGHVLSPPPTRATVRPAGRRSPVGLDSLQLQLAQKEAALGRTRMAVERTSHMATQAQAAVQRLKSEVAEEAERREAARTEAAEWRATAQASAASAAVAEAKLVQTEEQLLQFESELRLANEAVAQAERAKAEAAESMYPADER